MARAKPCSPKLSKSLLSPRIQECAELMKTGLSTREIAVRMGVSLLTVATYSKRIYATLKLKGRAELQAMAAPGSELERLRRELVDVRKDRDRVTGMYRELSDTRGAILTRNIELEEALNLFKTGILKIRAMPADDDAEIFKGIVDRETDISRLEALREAFAKVLQDAREAGAILGQGLAEQLALLATPTAARELAEAKEDAARVNCLYDVVIKALRRSQADLAALQSECLTLASEFENCSPRTSSEALRKVVEASKVQARHKDAEPAPE